MRGLDTNVLLRLLLRDDEAQARKVRALVERSVHDGEVLHVSLPVLCELTWVLAVEAGRRITTCSGCLRLHSPEEATCSCVLSWRCCR